ncbi:MAG: GH1 family beta-glucosidase [Actinomycetota bacterium]
MRALSDQTVRRFPAGFLFGASTSAYQVEGAVREDGRGESIWDRFSHTAGRIEGGDSGDSACDHYHRYRQDVALMVETGLSAYRFSISWPRVVPEGLGGANPLGLDFYDRLVDEILRHGIVPFVTLYHWDLPQALEDAGGWPRRLTANAFADYASIVAQRLGDRVSSFATINEPYVVSHFGYRTGSHAPGRMDNAAALASSHHLLVAHGLAVEAIRAVAPHASVGIVLNFEPQHPASDHPLDIEAAAIADEQLNRWYLDPITGRDYPDDGARVWGWKRGEVRAGDMDLIAARLDFLGVNYYTRRVVPSPHRPLAEKLEPVERTGMGWEVYPEGLREVLDFVGSRTSDLPLYITENGAAYPVDRQDRERDPERVSFLRRHLDAAADALEQGIPLRGYFVWSLLDNFEWAHGYSQRFGIIHVDFDTMERRIRDSGRFWARVAKDGALPPE